MESFSQTYIPVHFDMHIHASLSLHNDYAHTLTQDRPTISDPAFVISSE